VLGFPSPTVFAGGELRSMIEGARGVSPADVSSAMASSFAAPIKAFVSAASGSSSVVSGDGDGELGWFGVAQSLGPS
jgi:hypothetical protein